MSSVFNVQSLLAKIISHKLEVYYVVEWEGYDITESTIEPEKNISDELIDEFHNVAMSINCPVKLNIIYNFVEYFGEMNIEDSNTLTLDGFVSAITYHYIQNLTVNKSATTPFRQLTNTLAKKNIVPSGNYVYLRLSNREPTNENEKLDNQKERIKRYFQRNDIPEDCFVLSEIKSAYSLNTKRKLEKMINVMNTGDTLYVACCDRFSRRVDYAMDSIRDIHERGLNIVFVDENIRFDSGDDEDEFEQKLLEIEPTFRLAENYSYTISLKIRQALLQKRKREGEQPSEST